MVERYVRHNRLNILVTLTFDQRKVQRPTDRKTAMQYGAEFVRRLRAAGFLRNSRAYVYVPELHKDGVHYHLHVVLFGFVPKSVLETAHPHGFVDARRFSNKGRGNGSGNRIAASYVAKYVGKSYGDGHEGAHRYEVGQGCQPTGVKIEAPTLDEWRNRAIGAMGGELPVYEWRNPPEWIERAPPAIKLEWID